MVRALMGWQAPVNFGWFVALMGLLGCQGDLGAVKLEKHSQVRPSQDRTRLLVFDSRQLRSVKSRKEISTCVAYSPRLNLELPLSFASGDKRRFLAMSDKVFDVSANPPKLVTEDKIDPWADSPIAVCGRTQSLAYISSYGDVFEDGAPIEARGATGVYGSSEGDYLYVTTESALEAYDTKTRSKAGKLHVNNPKNLVVVNHGKDVLFAHDANKASLYDRKLSKAKLRLKFDESQSIWSLDVFDHRLVVVTWEGAAFSARWVARFYDIKTGAERRSLEFRRPVACYVMQGNRVAIVGEESIAWEAW